MRLTIHNTKVHTVLTFGQLKRGDMIYLAGGNAKLAISGKLLEKLRFEGGVAKYIRYSTQYASNEVVYDKCQFQIGKDTAINEQQNILITTDYNKWVDFIKKYNITDVC